MATKVKLYIGLIVALGLMLLTGSLTWFREFRDLPQYLTCLTLACIASTMKVRLPGLKGTISVNFVFILIGIAELSLSETILLSFAAAIVPLAQKREYAIALNLQSAAAGQQAQAADKLRAQLEAMQSNYNYILAKKYAFPSAVQ